MLYAILCYDSEAVGSAWTKEQDAAAIAKLDVVEERLARDRRLGLYRPGASQGNDLHAPVKRFAHLARETLGRERLLKKGHPRLENAMLQNGVVRITGHE